jgi:hypothetical protein
MRKGGDRRFRLAPLDQLDVAQADAETRRRCWTSRRL